MLFLSKRGKYEKSVQKDGSDFWDFDCKVGKEGGSATEIHVSEINKGIDRVANESSDQVYVEILAKPGYRTKKD